MVRFCLSEERLSSRSSCVSLLRPGRRRKDRWSFQPDLAGRAVEAIWLAVCLAGFFRQVEELSQSLGCLVGLVAKPSGSGGTLRF